MDFTLIFNQMAMLFIVAAAGYIIGKLKLINQDFCKTLSNVIVDFTCPCLIIYSTMGDNLPKRELILPLLFLGVLTYFVLLLLAHYIAKIFKVQDADKGIYSFMMVFGNVGFIGYPVIDSIFGHEAVFYAAILNVANTVTIFVWGAQFVTGQKDTKSSLKRLYSPAMFGTYISILIVALQLKFPEVISQPIKMIGNITVPGSLIIIGFSISQIPFKKMFGGFWVYVTAFLRLFLLPIIVFLSLRALGIFDITMLKINTIVIAMPVASFGTIFCLKFGRDETLMAQGTFITTLLSLITIPIMAMLIN